MPSKPQTSKGAETSPDRGPLAPRPAVRPGSAKRPVSKERLAEERQQEHFTLGTELFQSRKFGAARRMLEKVRTGPNVGLSHRAGVFIQICRKHSERKRPLLETVEDYYNHGVQLVNNGQFADAVRVLNRGLAKDAEAAHLHYVKGVAKVLAGDHNSASKSIRKAIELDSEIRILARRDPDLRSVIRSAPFADLVADKPA